MFLFINLTVFALILYSIFWIANYEQTKKLLKKNLFRKVIPYTLLAPFIFYALEYLSEITYSLLQILKNAGLYFQWVPYSYFTDAEHLSENGSPKWLWIANLYLMISIVYNWKNSQDLDSILDILHLILNTMSLPVIVFIFINDKLSYTFEPWVYLFEPVHHDNVRLENAKDTSRGISFANMHPIDMIWC